LFTDDHQEEVKDNHGETVLERLEKRLEKKQSELEGLIVVIRQEAGSTTCSLIAM